MQFATDALENRWEKWGWEERGAWRSPWGREPWVSPRGLLLAQEGVLLAALLCLHFRVFAFFFLLDVYFKHCTLRAYKED